MSSYRQVAAEIARRERELNLLSGDIDVQRLVLDVVSKGVPGIPIEESIISGEVRRTMYGASEVTVTVHDLAREIVNSGRLQDSDGELRAIDIQLDGLWFRLTRLRKQGDDVVLTFEDRDVAWLRAKKGPRKAASRAKVTRAQYVLSLIKSVRARRIPYKIHQLNTKQPIASTSEKVRKETRDSERRKGFDSGEKIDGVTSAQLKQIAICMEEWEELKAGERAVLAGLVAGFGESGFDPSKVDFDTGTHKGVFQSNQIPQYDTRQQARYFMIGGRSFREGAAKVAREHPDWSVGRIAEYVEVSGAGAGHYDRYRKTADRLLEAWGGASTESNTAETYFRRYEYKVDRDETYWDAIQRLAREVNWVAFFSGGTFFYISEQDLLRSRGRYRFSEDTPGVSNIDFEQDYRKSVERATVSCRIDRWAAPPGTVVIVDGLGTGSGRWLVEEITRNLYSAEATIDLKRPARKRKEPRPEAARRDTGDASGDSGSGGVGQVFGDTNGINSHVMDFLQEVAGRTNEKIIISSGVRPADSDSLHSLARAADIDVLGDARHSDIAGRKGDNIAAAVGRVCGLSEETARKRARTDNFYNFSVNLTWRGARIEVGWRTTVGGNHYNHVHIGFETLPSS